MTPRKTHTAITDIIKSAGYWDAPNFQYGVCAMGIQAFFIEKGIDIFNERNKLIESFDSSENFKKQLNESKASFSEILAFFEGIHLHQNPNWYLKYFDNQFVKLSDIKRISSLTASIELEKQGGLDQIAQWFGIYTPAKLSTYIDLLHQYCWGAKSNLAFVFNTHGACLTVCYDSGKKDWLLINPQDLPPKKMSSYELSKSIWSCLSTNQEIVGIETQVITTGNMSELESGFIGSLQLMSTFKKLHTITQEEVNLANSHKVALTYIAATFGHLDTIKQLIQFRANLTLESEYKKTPIVSAAQQGYADIVELLAEQKCDVNQLADGWAPIHVAAYMGHESVIKKIINHKANVDLQDGHNFTAACFAASRGFPEVMRILAETNADLYKCNGENLTPTLLAAQHGHIEVLEVLRQFGVKLSHSGPNFQNPIQRAIAHSQSATVDYLKGYRTHSAIMNCVDNLGYRKEETGGECFGTGLMAGQALFQNELSQFNARNNIITTFFRNKNFLQKVAEFKNQTKNKSSFLKRRNTTEFSTQIMIDIFCFLDSVELYQKSSEYTGWFDGKRIDQSKVEKIMPLVESEGLKKHKGLVKIDSWVGIYPPKKLRAYCDVLAETAEYQGQSILYALLNVNHFICLFYRARDKQWFFIDANQLPSIKISPQDMPRYICSGFLSDGLIVAFSTVIITTGIQSTLVKKTIDAMLMSPAFRKLHTVTEQDAKLTTACGSSLTIIAATNNDLDTIKQIIDKRGVLDCAYEDSTPISTAIYRNHFEIVSAFVEQKLLGPHGKSKDTPLILAASLGRLSIVKLLIESGVDLDAANADGVTPLSFAAIAGNSEVVDLLATNKADVNIVSKKGSSPSFFACKEGHTNTLRILAKHNAILNTISENASSVSAAAYNGHVDILEILTEHNINLETRTSHAQIPIPIIAAAITNKVAVIEFLAKKKVDLDVVDDTGLNALHIAIIGKHPDSVRKLAECKANLALVTKKGNTAATLAAEVGQLSILKILAEYKVDLTQAAPNGCVPLEVAKNNKCDEVVRYLEGFGFRSFFRM